MTDNEKLDKIINTLFFGNKAVFARELNVSPQTVTNWMKRGISKDGITLIQKSIHSINPQWLLTGTGDMIMPMDLSKQDKSRDIVHKDRLIPFYDVETTGGYNGSVSSSDEGIIVGYIHPGGWFGGSETAAIRHIGDSMKEYPNGCVLAVREVKEKHLLVPGRNYVIETREYRVTKRVQRGSRDSTIMLYSSNEDKYDDGRLIHEPFELDLEDVIHIYSILGYIVNQSGEIRLIKP